MLKLGMWEKANHHLVLFIIQLLNVKETKTESQIQMIKYALTCTLNEIEKFFLLWFLFYCMGTVKEFLVCFLSLASLRIFMGGSHRKTMLGCFVQSFLSFKIIILLSKWVELDNWMCYPIFIIAIAFIWKFTPIIPPQRPKYNDFQCMRFKAMALTALLILSIFSAALQGNYGNCIQWTVLVQIVENSMGILINERGKKQCLK
ncbi:MAG: accessory gene regulator B family protein [Lachnospiraceae bacterium]|nr:accessory gene regulator B family protein [Lachnospiraceae bacterium]